MRKLIVNNGAEVHIKDMLSGMKKTGMMSMMPLNQRKLLWNDEIRRNTHYGEEECPPELYRGIVIPLNADNNLSVEDLPNIVQEYAVGSYSADSSIADTFSMCGPDNNLDVFSRDYISVVIKFVDGDYLNVFQLYDENNIYERFIFAEKEYYCFPTEILIVKMELYLDGQPIKPFVP